MGIFTNFFKSKPAASQIIETGNKYGKLSKDQLIEKLLQLEKKKKKLNEQLKESEILSKKRKRSDEISINKKKSKKQFDFSKYETRFIALKFAYLGWNYNGLAVQKEPTPLPTVEGKMLEALYKCKMIPSLVPQECNFSRCGRTDKGVSAMNQVISLRVRSNLSKMEQMDSANDSKEIPYIHILNQLLPEDIRVSAICLRPPKNFNARFSCISRHYRYLFNKKGLNIDKMQSAAKLFEGEHDFRNFCKLDGSKQITNYNRNILKSEILQVENDIYCFNLIGSAFLWHQVRCMMANLFLVGQELEEVDLITTMLDIEKTPRKPVYEMASDVPLILYDCIFPEMEWISIDVDNVKFLRYSKAINALAFDYQLKSTISSIFKDTLPANETQRDGKIVVNLGDGKGLVQGHYKKMCSRDVMAPVDEVNAKYAKRKNLK